ncbi:MAG: dihydroneopterin aldolase [Chloroflexi bacterium]|nr:dihydroneopterin aldolase [Chloroflexota bacterium]
MTNDRVFLNGMVFYAHHGVWPEEKKLGQRFVVDVEMEGDLRRAGASDNIKDALDYQRAFAIVRQVMEGPSRDLLERLAEEMASRLLRELGAAAVRVRIKKPEVPIKGSVLDCAGIEIYRKIRRRKQDSGLR